MHSQIFQKYAGPNGRLLLRACHELFDALPLCALIQVPQAIWKQVSRVTRERTWLLPFVAWLGVLFLCRWLRGIGGTG